MRQIFGNAVGLSKGNSPGLLLRGNVSGNFRRFQEHYRDIGQVLLTCEGLTSRIGIPLLPPTKRVRELRSNQGKQSSSEIIRTGLAHIPTTTLEAYCDDLETLPDNEESNKVLGILITSLLERWYFPALVSVLVFLTTILLLRPSGPSISFNLAIASLIALGACVFCRDLVSDNSRRTSFCWVVSREILRRQGLDGSNEDKKNVRLVQAEPSPS